LRGREALNTYANDGHTLLALPPFGQLTAVLVEFRFPSNFKIDEGVR
jgi:hypothetical protein